MSLMGTTIGHIRITDRLGSGGMGDVYVGFDETLRRRVAVKSIKREAWRQDAARARFLREARVLSQLDHPHICRIHDYVEGEETDILVLELVEGKDLRERSRAGLDHALRLKVGEQVAEALAAAHAKGIVHRDIKPSNVMLTAHDEVRVLDFGLARFVERGGPRTGSVRAEPRLASAPPVAEADPEAPTVDLPPPPDPDPDPEETAARPLSPASLETRLGGVTGTPMYMSPEQARGEPATAASDMFSFGLLLQELFTGELPHDGPTDRDSLLTRARRGETRPLQGLPADLTSLIVRLKAPAASARPSAREAAERLRWIREKPRRRLRTLAAAALAAAALLGGLKYTLDLRRERAAAVEARDQAEELVRFLVGLFAVSDPASARGRTITAREILEQGARQVSQGLAHQPRTQARLMETIGTVYTRLGLYDDAEPLLERALELRSRASGPDDLALSQSLVELAVLRDRQAKYADGEALARRSLALRESILGPDHLDTAASLRVLGLLADKQEKYAEAARSYRRALLIRERALGPHDPAVAESLHDLGILDYLQGRYVEAEPVLKRALDVREKALGADHPEVGSDVNSLAALYFQQARYAEAEVLYERALAIWEKTLGPEHPDVALGFANLGMVRRALGRNDEAADLYRRSLALRERTLGPGHPYVADSLGRIADLLVSLDRRGEAEPLLRRALAILEASAGPQSLQVAHAETNLASLYDDVGRYLDAERLARHALAVREKALAADDLVVAESAYNLAHVCHHHRRLYDEAEDLYRRALDIRARGLAAADPVLAQTRKDYADLLRLRGRGAEADRIASGAPPDLGGTPPR